MAAPSTAKRGLGAKTDGNQYSRPKKKKRSENEAWKRLAKYQKRHNIDDETFQYYCRIWERLQDKFESDDDKDVFVNNVFDEIQAEKQEFELACHKLGCQILERLLPLANFQRFQPFLEVMRTDLRKACGNPQSSRVIEVLLHQCLKWIRKFTDEINRATSDDAEGDLVNLTYLSEWMVTFTSFMINNLQEFMFDRSISHVLRILIRVVAGGVEISDSTKTRRLQQNLQEIQGREGQGEDKNSIVPCKHLHKHLKRIHKQVMKLELGNGMVLDPNASGVLQVLLAVLQQTKAKKCKSLNKKIIRTTLTQHGEVERASLPPIVTDPNGSHLLEKVITTSSSSSYDDVLELLKTGLGTMASHPIANFAVQRLVGSCHNDTQFEILMEHLLPEIKSVFQHGHYGIITRLAEKCVLYKSQQSLFLQTLMSTLHCWKPTERHIAFAPAILQLVKYKDIQQEGTSELVAKLQGSLILQSLLRFKKPSKVVTSILTIPQEQLLSLACSPCGSHLVESFVKSPNVQDNSKTKFVLHYKGNYVNMACSKHGSRSLEAFWESNNMSLKTQIAQELAAQETMLQANFFGRFAFDKFAIHHFKHRLKDWKQIQTKDDKKRKMFRDILGDKT